MIRQIFNGRTAAITRRRRVINHFKKLEFAARRESHCSATCETELTSLPGERVNKTFKFFIVHE